MGLVSERAPLLCAAGYRVFDIRTEGRDVHEVLVNRPAEGTTPQLFRKRSFRSLRRGRFGRLSNRPPRKRRPRDSAFQKIERNRSVQAARPTNTQAARRGLTMTWRSATSSVKSNTSWIGDSLLISL